MPLQRMNASTTEELRKTYDAHLARSQMTVTFKRFFDADCVNDFFYDVDKPEDQLFAFSQYYDDDRLNSTHSGIYELWNEWSNTKR
jgi:hypothetical protein